ncbi:DUF4362 domain-containing protein [Paenibacillus sp. MMS20-IR301]|uniref:DUF4362 domain-containing protein n=1 Tax=Paenibacillus sp. MMS20-IR301 TaxID=2895946 RepID=UPI0028F0C5DD|nr:DUF4362 domain-containing protein [Paenibacillus sp. MMS20-IR301]WNS45930.1 DUF4362 domain-containing protein [Paenibacillus sp. MMS20-IR301]
MMKRILKLSPAILLLQTLIIVVLSVLLIREMTRPVPLTRDQRNLISHFDQLDLDRITEMIHRFNDGKGDNLTVLQWGVDSGPFIHDVYGNGRELHWTIDTSRDWAGDNSKVDYVCRAVRLDGTGDFYRVELSQCDNQPEGFKLNPISFRKDEL